MTETTSAKKTIQYDEGGAALSLMDGQIAKRGEPIEVSAELADELLTQAIWYEVGKEPAEGVALIHADKPETEEELREQKLAERPEPTEAAVEKAEEVGVDLDEVDGSGGRDGDQVTVGDVKEAAAQPSPTTPQPQPPESGGSRKPGNRR